MMTKRIENPAAVHRRQNQARPWSPVGTVFVNFLPFEKDNLDKSKLIPWILNDYMSKREANAFIYDINNAVFRENPSYATAAK